MAAKSGKISVHSLPNFPDDLTPAIRPADVLVDGEIMVELHWLFECMARHQLM